MAESRNTKNSKNRRGTALTANVPMEMAQAVYEQVRNGSYDSAGGVVRAALQLLLNLDDEGQALPPPTTPPEDGDLDADRPRGRSRRRRTE